MRKCWFNMPTLELASVRLHNVNWSRSQSVVRGIKPVECGALARRRLSNEPYQRIARHDDDVLSTEIDIFN